jgi:O-antigen/teichoic acid export membrane protein
VLRKPALLSFHRLATVGHRLGDWPAILSRFLAVQSAVQLIGMIAGLLVVRALTKNDYALYTLVNSAIGVFFSLFNSGLTEATTAIGGRVWQNPLELGRTRASASASQRRQAFLCFVPVAAVVGWLIARNGASPVEIVFFVAMGAITAYLQLSSTIAVTMLRLHSRIAQIQKLDLIGASLRLVLFASLFFILDVRLAILVVLVSAAVPYLLVRRWIRPVIDVAASPDPDMQRQMRGVVHRQWFNELNYILQGQIYIFVLGIFGGTQSVADFGALGRIAAIFGILGATMQSIILPAYARCQDPIRLRRLYLAILAGYVAVVMLPVAVTAAVPQSLLWLLGAKYQGLPRELILMVLNTSVGSIAGVTWALNSTRAWILPAWINVPVGIGCQIVLMAIIGVSSVEQVLWVGIISNLLMVFLNLAATMYFSRGFGQAR